MVPDTGQSRSQQVEVTGRSDLGFGSHEADPLLRLGGIVALAADRYSSLPRGAEDGPAGVSTDLAILQEELGALAGPLGGLDAYRDFRFLLERMAERAYSRGPAGSPLRLQPLTRSAPAGHPDRQAPGLALYSDRALFLPILPYK